MAKNDATITYRDKTLKNDVVWVLNNIPKNMKDLKLFTGIFSMNGEIFKGNNGVCILPRELRCYKEDITYYEGDKGYDRIINHKNRKEIKYIILVNKDLKDPQKTIIHELRHAEQHKRYEFEYIINTLFGIIDHYQNGAEDERPIEKDAKYFSEKIMKGVEPNRHDKWIKETTELYKQRKSEIKTSGVGVCLWNKNHPRYEQLIKTKISEEKK